MLTVGAACRRAPEVKATPGASQVLPETNEHGFYADYAGQDRAALLAQVSRGLFKAGFSPSCTAFDGAVLGVLHRRPPAGREGRRRAGAARLPVDRRSLVLAFARQSAIDAISHVLGILDGTSGLPGAPGLFRLHYGAKSKPLTGDLQDYFLGAVEEAGADRWLRRAMAGRARPGRKRRKSRPAPR